MPSTSTDAVTILLPSATNTAYSVSERLLDVPVNVTILVTSFEDPSE